MKKQSPKVVVIGAGSLFFGRQAIWQMVHSPYLNKGTLALVDTNPDALAKMKSLAEMVISNNGVDLKLEASIERKDVLNEADFVVLSFADRSVKFRGIDCEVALKNGIRMCSGDTIGPGGIFRTLREFPVIMQCAEDIISICPNAWVINYINPAAANGIGLRRYAPELKSFSLCDGLHMPIVKKRYAVRAGIIDKIESYTDQIDSDFDLRIAGTNHFTWMIKAEYKGRDMMPVIGDQLRKKAALETDGGDTGAKARFNQVCGYELYRAFGHIPTCVAHTKEYVRFWQGLSKTPESIPPLSIWKTGPRYKRHQEMWDQVDGFINGKIPINKYMSVFGPDHATDIIENMVGNLGKPFYINTHNNGAVINMAMDSFLELCCDIDMSGPRPRPTGEMPRGLRAMQEQIQDTHELTVQAAVTRDRNLLRRAMLTDPIVNSLSSADAIITELIERERDALPEEWFQ